MYLSHRNFLLISQDKVVFQQPESCLLLSVDGSLKWCGIVCFGHCQIVAPENALWEAVFGTENRVQDESWTSFIVEGGVEFFKRGMRDKEMLSTMEPILDIHL